jgi:hypothetical protein
MNRANDKSVSVTKRNCVFIGKRDSGKTTIFYAASRSDSMPARDCNDGTECCETDTIDEEEIVTTKDGDVKKTFSLSFIDTVGFRGIAGTDRAVQAHMIREIQSVGDLHAIFVVCKFKRFDYSDTAVISFLRSYFSDQAKEKMWLIIMNCLPKDQKKALEQLVNPQRYKIVDGIEKRVMFFDLPDFNSFPEPEAFAPIQNRYEAARAEIRSQLKKLDPKAVIRCEDVAARSMCVMM